MLYYRQRYLQQLLDVKLSKLTVQLQFQMSNYSLEQQILARYATHPEHHQLVIWNSIPMLKTFLYVVLWIFICVKDKILGLWQLTLNLHSDMSLSVQPTECSVIFGLCN